MKIYFLLCLLMLSNLTITDKTGREVDIGYKNIIFNKEIKDSVFFSKEDGVYSYEKNKEKLFQKSFWPSYPKIKDNFMYWKHELENENVIEIYNITDKTMKSYRTAVYIYDLQFCDNYIIFSGLEYNTGLYKISYIDIISGEEITVSDTQNNQVMFSYFNDEIYFFEPRERNNLYKYNIKSKSKSKLSNKIKNLTTIRMELCVNKHGIYFTNTEDCDTSNLYRLNLDSQEIDLIEKNVDSIMKLDDDKLYLMKKSNIIEYDCSDNTLQEVIKFNYSYDVRAVQNNYIIVDNMSLAEVRIYDINSGEEIYRTSFFID